MVDYIPVLSLIVAALAIFVGPAIAYSVVKKQIANSLAIANKQVIAPMRQTWIDNVRDIVSEIISTAQWWYVAADAGELKSFELADDYEQAHDVESAKVELKLMRLMRRLELMLNPKEQDHNELIELVRYVIRASDGSLAHGLGLDEVDSAMAKCKAVLKREWEVVKSGD